MELSALDGEPAPDGDRASRRPRRYFTPGDSRLSERFRTQPITSAERLQSDRWGGGGWVVTTDRWGAWGLTTDR